MKTGIILCLCLIGLIYTSGPVISFRPFSVSFEKPYLLLGLIFLCLSLVCYLFHFEKKGYKRGVKDATETIIEILKKVPDENNPS